MSGLLGDECRLVTGDAEREDEGRPESRGEAGRLPEPPRDAGAVAGLGLLGAPPSPTRPGLARTGPPDLNAAIPVRGCAEPPTTGPGPLRAAPTTTGIGPAIPTRVPPKQKLRFPRSWEFEAPFGVLARSLSGLGSGVPGRDRLIIRNGESPRGSRESLWLDALDFGKVSLCVLPASLESKLLPRLMPASESRILAGPCRWRTRPEPCREALVLGDGA